MLFIPSKTTAGHFLKWPLKVRQKLFKRPKGLAACELQAAGPFALP